jgi:dihydrofolate synthase/folylpolyglutamate synthase
LRQLDLEIQVRHEPGRVTADGVVSPRLQITTDRRRWPTMQLGLLGEHQAANAALAVAVVEHLQDAGWHINEPAVAAGLARVRWPARLEVVGQHPTVLLDCAHNVASVQALVDTLERSLAPPSLGRRRLIFASSNDKDLAGMFQVLAPHFHDWYLTRYSHNPRSADPEHLAGLLRPLTDRPIAIHGAAAEAWEAARKQSGPDDVLCITGSVFLAGELRPLIDEGSQVRGIS